MKTQGAELVTLKEKQLKLVEDHSQVSYDFAKVRRQLEDGFVSIAVASTNITMWVK